MNCCIDCFSDVQFREIIKASNKIGICSFCDRRDIPVYSVDTRSDLSDLIEEIINVYEENDDGEPIFDVLVNDWNIFNKELPSVFELVEKFFSIIYENGGCDYNKSVRIPNDYVEKYGIFSGHSWEEFSSVIKNKNRFYNDFFKADKFVSFLSYSINKYSKETIFYRARICSNKNGYSKNEMGAPPREKRKSGRVNPEGIGVLYLASDEETALSEVRASAFDFVSVGEFRLKKDIRVVNISGLKNISPIIYSSSVESLAVNIKVFGDIAKEIAKPLRRNDSPLEYLPTQYITEFIKSNGYFGVEFASTMATGGNNIAVFDESLFECISIHNVEIKKINYIHENCI